MVDDISVELYTSPTEAVIVQNPDGVAARLAHEQAANALGLTDEDRQQLLPSGAQPMYKNRAGWAHDRLKRVGLSSSPRRGFWKATTEGIAFAKEHAKTETEMRWTENNVRHKAGLSSHPGEERTRRQIRCPFNQSISRIWFHVGDRYFSNAENKAPVLFS